MKSLKSRLQRIELPRYYGNRTLEEYCDVNDIDIDNITESQDITDMISNDDPKAINDPDDWNSQYITYEELYNHSSYEFFSRHFTSPSGDKLVAWGFYGYDG